MGRSDKANGGLYFYNGKPVKVLCRIRTDGSLELSEGVTYADIRPRLAESSTREQLARWDREHAIN